MKNIFLFMVMLFALAAPAQQLAKTLKAANGQTVGFMEFKPTDYGSQLHPLIIYLHGIGERGADGNGTTEKTAVAVQANEIPKLTAGGASMKFTVNCESFSFVILSPQLYANYGNWQNFYIDEILKYAKANLKIDTNRIYLTGISLGGGGVWKYASTSVQNASQFAAIAPVCGTCDWSNLCNISQANTPVWAFHAVDDGVVGVGCTNSAVAGLKSCATTLTANVTIYPNGNHWIWARAYDTTNTWHTPNLFQWFLTHKRTPAQAPSKLPVSGLVANAGTDQTVVGPTATLDGGQSSGYKGEWAVYWALTEQPTGSTYNVFPGYNKMGTKITLQNLASGRYKFVLTVEDGKGNKATDEVIINVR